MSVKRIKCEKCNSENIKSIKIITKEISLLSDLIEFLCLDCGDVFNLRIYNPDYNKKGRYLV